MTILAVFCCVLAHRSIFSVGYVAFIAYLLYNIQVCDLLSGVRSALALRRC